MSRDSLITDPSARFIDEQQNDVIDFIFRLTADRSRAAVMARECCRQMKDELQSQSEETFIRSRLFQLAYDLNEEAMRPIGAEFFQAWFRQQHDGSESADRAYRWEIKLLEWGQHAAMLLLLRYRYGFPVAACAWILERSESEAAAELALLLGMVQEEKGLDVTDLAQLPHYGFLAPPESQSSTLSQIISRLGAAQYRRRRGLVLLILLLIVIVSLYEAGQLDQLLQDSHYLLQPLFHRP